MSLLRSALDEALRYHERTKHHPGRYAAGPGQLDWASQPDPFRRFNGALRIPLVVPEPIGAAPRFDDAVQGAVAAIPMSERLVSQLLYDALAISAWKVAGTSRWAVRCNLSSGNLHPTEAYLLLPPVQGLAQAAGLYHYSVEDHALERLREIPAGLWMDTVQGLPQDGFLMALTSIHWREAWKYGERAYRYCQHDVGHAVAQLSYAAAAMGWHVRILSSVGDASIAALTGTDRQSGEEAEQPDVMLCISPRSCAAYEPVLSNLSEASLQAWRALPVQGIPNALSPTHRAWPEIERVAVACTRHPGDAVQIAYARPAFEPNCSFTRGAEGARSIYRARRSAVAMDGRTRMAQNDFLRLVARLLPSAFRPWTAFPSPAAIHPVFFVHRVDGMAPGAYLLVRNAERAQVLREALTQFPDAQPWDGWKGPGELLCLASGDVQGFAHNSNCLQEIASEGAFAVAMLADFREVLEREGAWAYRRLFWEAGFLGQVLYLEAQTCGLRGTGIGCFFDDAIHKALGVKGDSFQSLYGFTVGGAVDDERVRSAPSYLSRARELQA